MGFFNFWKQTDINQEIKTMRSISDAVLLDVRSPQEYREGHIPGSKNVPLQEMSRAAVVVPSKDTPVYVYCYSGSRSRQAAEFLKKMGYANVTNMGGIAAYSGKVER